MAEEEKKSFVKAAIQFFSSGPYGRKVEIKEFQALTNKDKAELSEMLIAAGHDHIPYTAPSEG